MTTSACSLYHRSWVNGCSFHILLSRLERVSAWGPVFRARAECLGIVEIHATHDFSPQDFLYLIHPWIDVLLDRQPVWSVTEVIPNSEENSDDRSFLISDSKPPSFPGPSNIAPETTPRDSDVASLQPPSSLSQTEREMRAFQLMARLRQPLGALLFTPTHQDATEYRRVAAESLITVQVQEDAPLQALIRNTLNLDVL